MSTQAVSPIFIEQAHRWLDQLNQAQAVGHWAKFDEKCRAFVGFVRAISADPGASITLLDLFCDLNNNKTLQIALQAIDKAVQGLIQSEDKLTPLFSPVQPALESCAAKLAAYVQHAPTTLSTFGESKLVIDRSISLRQQLEDLLNTSTDFEKPAFESLVLYVFGTLLANTPPRIYHPLLGNPNHIPFHFELLLKCGESILNVLRVQQERIDITAVRLKSEKFSILDAPKLLAADLSTAYGALGTSCLYIDIDNFKPLNTRFSERIVDKDIIPDFQRLISQLVVGIGFAYAEGGDEVTILGSS